MCEQKSFTFLNSDIKKFQAYSFKDLEDTVGCYDTNRDAGIIDPNTGMAFVSYLDEMRPLNIFVFLKKVVMSHTRQEDVNVYLKEFKKWVYSEGGDEVIQCLAARINHRWTTGVSETDRKDSAVLDHMRYLYQDCTKTQFEMLQPFMLCLNNKMAHIRLNWYEPDRPPKGYERTMARVLMWEYYFGYCANGYSYAEEVIRERNNRDHLKRYARGDSDFTLWKNMHAYTGMYALPGPREIDYF